MSGHACTRGAADLTGVVDRLGRVARVLDRQAAVPVEDFGGLSGDAFRRHVTASSVSAVALASDVALLAGALATLGRELDRVAGLRSLGHAARASEVEHAAQSAWREAVARFEGRASTTPPPPPAVHPQTPSPPDVATPPSQPASAGADPPPSPPATPPPPESPAAPVLDSGFVTPGLPPGLEATFVPPRREGGDG